jgi:3-methyl-2-oxobutanoate hydroxymethyltransferase
MNAPAKVTLTALARRKAESRKIAVLTCYDYPTARLMEQSGMDVILVGDTYAEVVLGHDSTLPATMDALIPVTAAVRRGAPNCFLIGDMPYLSYQAALPDAVHNAGRFMAEAGCDAVKVEVDHRLLDVVETLARATIPVVAHLGLRPQSIHVTGGYKGQGKTADTAREIMDDARRMEEAGASMLLLEAVPRELAGLITERSRVPVIGCASGPDCDGTVVVLHDMLGYNAGHPPRCVKRYAHLHDELIEAFRAYRDDVENAVFPAANQCLRMSEQEHDKLLRQLQL